MRVFRFRGPFGCVCGAVFLLPHLVSAASNTWSSSTSLNQARSGSAAVRLSDGRILFTGGTGGSGPLASTDFFNTDGSISAGGSMKQARSGHAAVVLQDGRVLVAGGTIAEGAVTNSAEIYDPFSNTWNTVPSGMNTARSGETVTLLNDGRVLIAGGQSTSGPTNTLEIYSPASNSFTLVSGALSAPRQQHAAALLQDGRVLVAGGSDGSKSLSSADIYDPSSGVIASAGSMAGARAGLSATTLLDGTVLLAGGNDGAKDLASADMYNPATPGFSAIAALGAARSGHLAFLLPNNNQVLIAGGTAVGTTLQSVELFTPWTGKFAFAAFMSTARSSAAGAASQLDGQLLVGAGANGTGSLSSTEIYKFATVKTDQADYAPGTTVNISGSGWQPGETVALTLVESPLIDTHGPFTAVADSNGNISNSQFATDSHDVNIRFYLTAVGSLSNAQTTFTDGAANVTFTTDSPCAVTVTATYTNNGGKAVSNQSFTTGTNAATVGTNPGSSVTYTYPSSMSCSTQTYTFVSATPASPFFSNGDSSPTTVQAHYVPAGTPAAITSGNNTTFTIGAAGSFTITATGSPTPTLTESGALPAGVSFNTSTGVLSGTPAPGTTGTYNISFTASNGVGTNAVQNFTLVVSQASTTTQLTSVSLNATYAQSAALTLTATVAANSPSTATVNEGTVTFTISTVPLTTVTGALSNGSATANLSVNGVNAGTYSIAATYNPATSSPNFTISAAGNQGTLTIGKANATISVTPYGVTYDGNAHTASASVKGVKGEDLTSALNLSGTTHTNAGDYPSDGWSFTGGTNYNDATGTVHDAIAKATPQVTATGGTSVYNGAPQAGTCAVLPTTLTVTPGYAPGPGAPVNAATYTLTCSVAATANYNANSNTAAITITAATPVLPPAQTGTSTYGTSVTLSVTINPVNGGEIPTGSVQFQFTSNNTTFNICSDGSLQTQPTAMPCAITLDSTGTAKVTTSKWTFTDAAGNYTNAQNTVMDVISQAPTSIALSSVTPGSNGAVMMVTAVVTNKANVLTPVGSVTFTDTFGPIDPNASTMSCTNSPSALSCQLTFSTLSPGTHLISATFASSNFAPNSATDANSSLSVSITQPDANNDVFAITSPVNLVAGFTGATASNPKQSPTAQWAITKTGTNYSFTAVGTVSGSIITGSPTFSSGVSAGAGVYGFTLTFTDGLGGIVVANTIAGSPAMVVIYDPNAGFVTGGGWINSLAGAYTANPTLTGKATFGFVSKYQKGANVPSGDTQFQFQAGDFNFHSTAYTWMVISGGLAQYQGSGTVNGTGNYNFMLTARDGSQYGGGAQDGFRIRITDQTGSVVYDNMPAATSTSMTSGNTQGLGGGSVIIHSN